MPRRSSLGLCPSFPVFIGPPLSSAAWASLSLSAFLPRLNSLAHSCGNATLITHQCLTCFALPHPPARPPRGYVSVRASTNGHAQATQMPLAPIDLRPLLAALQLYNPRLNGAGRGGGGVRGSKYGDGRRMKVGGSGRPTFDRAAGRAREAGTTGCTTSCTLESMNASVRKELKQHSNNITAPFSLSGHLRNCSQIK